MELYQGYNLSKDTASWKAAVNFLDVLLAAGCGAQYDEVAAGTWIWDWQTVYS